MSPFAARQGAGIVELLRLTGFRTYREFIKETTPMERKLITESIAAWHDKRQGQGQGHTGGGGGGGGGLPPGMGL